MSLDSLPTNISENFSQFDIKVSPYKFSANIFEQDDDGNINSSKTSPHYFSKRNLYKKERKSQEITNLPKEFNLKFTNPFFPPRVQAYGNSFQRKMIKESPTSGKIQKNSII